MKSVVHVHVFCLIALTTVRGFANLRNGHITEEDAKIAQASCDFTLNLLKHVESKSNESNVVFSPASISMLLSVLQQGAMGNTAKELEKLLSLTPEESRHGFKRLLGLKKEKNVTLEWGNKCYVRPGMELSDEFRYAARNDFEVEVEEMNFGVPSAEESAHRMNTWVKEVTHGQITNLVDPSSISVETIMVMINAIFFKGTWAKPFKKSKTTVDKFETNARDSVQTYFMSQREKYYSDKDSALGAKWVQQPFQNGRFSMIYILPTRRHRLRQLLTKMNGRDLYKIFSHIGVSHVKLRIPRFKVSEKVSLVQTLSELGLRDVFTPASDLSGISPSTPDLSISDMIHQANVEVDEKGGSGSAATVVQFLRMRPPTLSFVADHPFLFFIVDETTKIPLFAGKVANPQA